MDERSKHLHHFGQSRINHQPVAVPTANTSNATPSTTNNTSNVSLGIANVASLAEGIANLFKNKA